MSHLGTQHMDFQLSVHSFIHLRWTVMRHWHIQAVFSDCLNMSSYSRSWSTAASSYLVYLWLFLSFQISKLEQLLMVPPSIQPCALHFCAHRPDFSLPAFIFHCLRAPSGWWTPLCPPEEQVRSSRKLRPTLEQPSTTDWGSWWIKTQWWGKLAVLFSRGIKLQLPTW